MTVLQDNATRFPDRTALVDGDRSWTWARLHAESLAVARTLRREYGVRPGDVVASLMDNGAEHVLLLHAIWLCHATVAPLNTRLAPPELERQLSFLHPVLLITEYQVALSDIPAVSAGDVLAGVADLSDNADAGPSADGDGDALRCCSILFTSGTAGTVKAVPHSWANHRASAIGSAANLGVRDDDNWLCVIPLFHIGGLAIVTRSLFYGTAMTVRQGFDVAAVTGELRDRRVTLMSVVPTMLSRLLEADATLSAVTLPALRAVLLGGAGASSALWEEAARRGLPVLGTYGLTESCSQVVTASPAEVDAMAGTAGRPIGGAELRITCMDGKDCPAGTEGEIHLRGPMLTGGYLGTEGREDFADGWFRTRDIGFVDAHGCLHVCGRADDMIVTGGENVFPSEIEDVLLRHPSIREAAVTGIPDDEWGMTVAAMVVADGEADFAELEYWCRQELAGYKVPRRWRQVTQLPRTASGKVLREEVRKQFG